MKKMYKQEIDQLFAEPTPFVYKVQELAAQKDVEKPFDDFIMDLIMCNYDNLFEKLLQIYAASIRDGRGEGMKVMEAFMIAFDEFDQEELK